MNEQAKKKKLLKIILILLVVLLIVVVIIIRSVINSKQPKTEEEILSEYEKQKNERAIVDLSGKSENERMKYYCSEFFKYIGLKRYEEVYDMLYSEYKENYFPTLASFEKYMSEYFSEDVSITYNNIERLGNMYVLWIDVKEVYNNGYSFSMNIVIREDAYNDIKMSFSRNSAVDEREG